MKPRVVRIYFDQQSDGCWFTSSPDMPELKLAGDKSKLIETFPKNLQSVLEERGEAVFVQAAEMNDPDAFTMVVLPLNKIGES